MGTNTLETIGTGAPVEANGDTVDQYKTALTLGIVPRNASGVATDQAGGLGTVTYRWANLYLDNLLLDGNTISSTDTNGDINLTPNGTGSVVISKATIGASTLSGGMNCASQIMTSVNIDSGAIDGTTIGAASAAAGTFTTMGCTTANITTGTIGTLGGAMDCDSQAMTNANIDSGAVDNATVGANTASTGKFTDVESTGDVTSQGEMISFGDGSDGSLTTAGGGAGDVSLDGVKQYTSLTLAAGDTITVGSLGFLIIRVQGTFAWVGDFDGVGTGYPGGAGGAGDGVSGHGTVGGAGTHGGGTGGGGSGGAGGGGSGVGNGGTAGSGGAGGGCIMIYAATIDVTGSPTISCNGAAGENGGALNNGGGGGGGGGSVFIFYRSKSGTIPTPTVAGGAGGTHQGGEGSGGAGGAGLAKTYAL